MTDDRIIELEKAAFQAACRLSPQERDFIIPLPADDLLTYATFLQKNALAINRDWRSTATGAQPRLERCQDERRPK